MVIDPGGDDQQIQNIHETISGLIHEKPRPVFIYLTHCHIDHCLKTSVIFTNPAFQSFLFIHEEGAKALSGSNKDFILLHLFNMEMENVSGAIPLFSENDKKKSGDFCLDIPDSNGFEILSCIHHDENNFYTQKVNYKNDVVTLYHVPGHSPDSICIQIEDLLFIGDHPFAANPLVAGIKGWAQSDYITSLKNIIDLLTKEDFSIIISGHGNVSETPIIIKILSGILSEAQSLVSLPELNNERLKSLFEYSKILLDEAQRLFTIISGRIYKVGYFLNELDESEEAAKLEHIINFEEIDHFMSSLNGLKEEYENNEKKPELIFLFRYLVFLKKLRELFDPKLVSGLIEEHLLRRASGLLIDFFNTVRGFRYENLCAYEDINEILTKLTCDLKTSLYDHDEILESLDNNKDFIKKISRRIAYEPIFAHIEFDLSLNESLPKVFVEKSIFSDILLSLFESLAVRRSEKISIQTRSDGGKVKVTITPLFKKALPFSHTRHIEYINKTLRNYNINFVVIDKAPHETFAIEIPSHDENFHASHLTGKSKKVSG
jgi:glyoxylase-like metal-dependent hydrolase (beta-lactamase superfamily II)